MSQQGAGGLRESFEKQIITRRGRAGVPEFHKVAADGFWSYAILVV